MTGILPVANAFNSGQLSDIAQYAGYRYETKLISQHASMQCKWTACLREGKSMFDEERGPLGLAARAVKATYQWLPSHTAALVPYTCTVARVLQASGHGNETDVHNIQT